MDEMTNEEHHSSQHQTFQPTKRLPTAATSRAVSAARKPQRLEPFTELQISRNKSFT